MKKGKRLNSHSPFFSNIPCIISPKYDGCSFEAIISNGEIESISSRGDGNWGKDIKQHIIRKFNKQHTSCGFEKYTLRGEVLIDKNVFTEKYSDFVNPRSFVSGLLNRDYDEFDDDFDYDEFDDDFFEDTEA